MYPRQPQLYESTRYQSKQGNKATKHRRQHIIWKHLRNQSSQANSPYENSWSKPSTHGKPLNKRTQDNVTSRGSCNLKAPKTIRHMTIHHMKTPKAIPSLCLTLTMVLHTLSNSVTYSQKILLWSLKMLTKRKIPSFICRTAKKERKDIDLDFKMKVINHYEGWKETNAILYDLQLSNSTVLWFSMKRNT